MITSDLIIRYTNGLYSTLPENAPSYIEFRDMFSSGQIMSKEWLMEKLSDCLDLSTSNIIIVGAWFGTLGFLIKNKFPDSQITLLDIDQRCYRFIRAITYDLDGIEPVQADMFQYEYSGYNVIINTSCEHIHNLGNWVKCLPKGSIVILQSNNFKDGYDHVNCVSSISEFEDQVGLSKIIYSGELVMPMFTRFMIIGQV